jgi:hypothetical protein
MKIPPWLALALAAAASIPSVLADVHIPAIISLAALMTISPQ